MATLRTFRLVTRSEYASPERAEALRIELKGALEAKAAASSLKLRGEVVVSALLHGFNRVKVTAQAETE